MSWAFERDVFDFRYDPAEATRLLDAAGFRDPDGDGPRPRLPLTLKTSTSEVYRVQAAAIQQDLARVGIAARDPVAGVRDAARRRASRATSRCTPRSLSASPIPTCCAACFTRSQAPPAGLNRVYYRNADVDRLIERGGGRDRRRAAPGAVRAGAADRSRSDVPYHQPVVQDERGGVPARHPRRHALPDRGFHVPEGCVSRSARRRSVGRERIRWRRRPRSRGRPADAAGRPLRREPLRSPAALPHDLAPPHFDIHFHQGEEAMARRLAPHRRAGAGRSSRRSSGVAARPRARHPRRPDRPVERLGDAGPLQPIEITACRAVRRQLDREHRRLAASWSSPTSTRTSSTSIGRAGWIGGLRRVFGRAPVLFPNLLPAALADRRHRDVRGEPR